MTPAKFELPGVWTIEIGTPWTDPKYQSSRRLHKSQPCWNPEIAGLIADLQETRWTGRPGYPIRSVLGMALAKSIYAIPTWTRTVRLAHEHAALAAAIAPDGDVPSVYACYRFTAKMCAYETMLDACISAVLTRLREANPGMGENIAIDGSDLPAYANGQRFVSKK